MTKKQHVLAIVSGLGINDDEDGNAVRLANTPNLDKLMKDYPTTTIQTSGEAVGLPEEQMGDSEVGHINLGARKSSRATVNKN